VSRKRTDKSQELYGELVRSLRLKHARPDLVKEGEFGAMMDVAIANEGPVTIVLDTADK